MGADQFEAETASHVEKEGRKYLRSLVRTRKRAFAVLFSLALVLYLVESSLNPSAVPRLSVLPKPADQIEPIYTSVCGAPVRVGERSVQYEEHSLLWIGVKSEVSTELECDEGPRHVVPRNTQ